MIKRQDALERYCVPAPKLDPSGGVRNKLPITEGKASSNAIAIGFAAKELKPRPGIMGRLSCAEGALDGAGNWEPFAAAREFL